MNKRALLVLSLVFVSVIASGFASAYYFPDTRSLTQGVIDNYVNIGEPILSAMFGGNGWTGFMLFERFLLFIMLMSVIYVILERIPVFEGQKMVKWVVAIVVPLIGMRFVDYEWLSAVITQYGMLVIIMGSVLPFIIFFYFVHSIGKDYPVLRKVAWIFFIGVYMGLWNTAGSELQGAVFFWTVVAAVLMLLLDKRIEMYLAAKEFAKHDRWRTDDEIARITKKIQDIHADLQNNRRPDPKEAMKEIKELELQKKYLIRNRLSGS
jgi:hypothetical protein